MHQVDRCGAMAPSSDGGRHVYRTGLSTACKSPETRDRIRLAVRGCHAIKFATLEIFGAYAAKLAENIVDWELGSKNETLLAIRHVQSFLCRDGAEGKLPPVLSEVTVDFVRRCPDALARCRAFRGEALSPVLKYQADTIQVAFSNMLEYGAASLQRRWAMAKLELSRAEAAAVASCLGSDALERSLKAKESLVKRRRGEVIKLEKAPRSAETAAKLERAQARLKEACALGVFADDETKELASRLPSRFVGERRQKMVAAINEMAARLPSDDGIVCRFRYRALLTRELDAALDAAERPTAARAALFPRARFKPGFVRIDKAFRLVSEPREPGAHFAAGAFKDKKLKAMLTSATRLGPTFATDGVQLHVSVETAAVAAERDVRQAAATTARKENKRKRGAGEEVAAKPDEVAPKRAARARAAAWSSPSGPSVAAADPASAEPAAREPGPRGSCAWWIWASDRANELVNGEHSTSASVAAPVAFAPARSSPSAAEREPPDARTGVDPGHKNVYTAHRKYADGRPTETWTLSLGEYYCRIGASSRQQKDRAAKRNPSLRGPRCAELELELSRLPPSRSSYENFMTSCERRSAAFDELSAFYSRPAALRADFDVAMKKEALIAAEAKRLAPAPRHRVFWGNAAFSATRKGTMPAACALIRKAVERRCGADFELADEFRTSKTCSACYCIMSNARGQLSSKRERDNVARLEGKVSKKLHGVMQCQTGGCGRTWNRDVNAAINMLYVGITPPAERHLVFKR